MPAFQGRITILDLVKPLVVEDGHITDGPFIPFAGPFVSATYDGVLSNGDHITSGAHDAILIPLRAFAAYCDGVPTGTWDCVLEMNSDPFPWNPNPAWQFTRVATGGYVPADMEIQIERNPPSRMKPRG